MVNFLVLHYCILETTSGFNIQIITSLGLTVSAVPVWFVKKIEAECNKHFAYMVPIFE